MASRTISNGSGAHGVYVSKLEIIANLNLSLVLSSHMQINSEYLTLTHTLSGWVKVGIYIFR